VASNEDEDESDESILGRVLLVSRKERRNNNISLDHWVCRFFLWWKCTLIRPIICYYYFMFIV
jgi:hypothetical protein